MTGADRYHNNEEWCRSCGRSNALNGVTIGLQQVRWLIRLADEWGGSADHKKMDLRGSIYATCSYFRYWGLTENYDGVGTFHITGPGYAYLADELVVPQTCWRFDARTVEFEGPMVGISDVLRQHYDTYEDTMIRIARQRRFADEDLLWANVQRRLSQ